MSDNEDVTSCVVDVIGTELESMREQAKRRTAHLLGAPPEDLYAELAAPLVAVRHQQWVTHLGQPSVPLRWRGTFSVRVDTQLATERASSPDGPSPVASNVTPFRRGPFNPP